MKVLRVDHQFLEDKGFDLSLFDRLSIYCCFDRRIDSKLLYFYVSLKYSKALVYRFVWPYGMLFCVFL